MRGLRAGSATSPTSASRRPTGWSALRVELTKLGADVEVGPDWIAIAPGSLGPATIATYDDHRMAMAFAVAGLRQSGIVIEDPDCVAKTWPGFFEMVESL